MILVCDFFVISREVYEKKISELPLVLANWPTHARSKKPDGTEATALQSISTCRTVAVQKDKFLGKGSLDDAAWIG